MKVSQYARGHSTLSIHLNDFLKEELISFTGRDFGEILRKRVEKEVGTFKDLECLYSKIEIIFPMSLVAVNSTFVDGFFESLMKRHVLRELSDGTDLMYEYSLKGPRGVVRRVKQELSFMEGYHYFKPFELG